MRPNSTLHSLIFFFGFLLFSVTAFSQDLLQQDQAKRNQVIADAFAKRAKASTIAPEGISQNWYDKARTALEQREYSLQLLRPGEYGAANHPQHVGYMFTEHGYLVKNFNDYGGAARLWQTEFRFTGIGREGRMMNLPLKEVNKTGDRSLVYDYGQYTISYNNGNDGMEQVFVIKQRPEGGKSLQVSMQLKGDLEARTGENNQLLLCTAGNSKDVRLVYDQVKVFDRNKQVLPAYLTVNCKRQLVLSVDDSKAAYPVTVDPLNHVPSKVLHGQHLIFPLLDEITNPTLFGYSVSGAGDVNGDGFADVIIGAPLFVRILSVSGGTFSLAACGAAFIYFGHATGLDSIPDNVLQPTKLAPTALFGFSVHTAGDVNGNGKSDVIIGAPGDSVTFLVLGLPVSPILGKAYVYDGSVMDGSINTVPAFARALHLPAADLGTIIVNLQNPFFGWSVSTAGDVNKDGFADVLVGSPIFNNLISGGVLGGRVDVFNGSATGLPATSHAILGTIPLGFFGWSVSHAGDVNKDGFDDIIVGGPGTIIGATILGGAYVYHGSATGITGTSTIGAPPTGPNTTLSAPGGLLQTLFGFCVSDAGDVNGDGFEDVIVGEPLSIDGTLPTIVAAGHAYIFYGSGTGITTTGSTKLSSPRSPTILGSVVGSLLFGWSVSKAGDVNGDGFGDVIVGEPGSNVLGTVTSLLGLVNTPVLNGSLYLFLGKATGIPSGGQPDWILRDTSILVTPDFLGFSVHDAGDVDKDGKGDFIGGSPNGSFDLGTNITSVTGSLGSGALPHVARSSNNFFMAAKNVTITPLPVTLISFTANAENGQSVLNWSTAQEENSDHFEIQRSTDNTHYSVIGKVNAAHNSSMLTKYTFTDASPASGNNFYRLRQVDMDGKFAYSQVASLNFSGKENMISLYPNPAHGSVQLQFRNMPAGRYDMSLLSQSGQVLQSRSIQVTDPSGHNETISLPNLSQGTYLIRVVDPQQKTSIHKLLVQ